MLRVRARWERMYTGDAYFLSTVRSPRQVQNSNVQLLPTPEASSVSHTKIVSHARDRENAITTFG